MKALFFIFCCSSSFFFIFFFPGLAVRREVGADVRLQAFTVAILAQGTNRGDALCAALLLHRVGSNPTATTFHLLEVLVNFALVNTCNLIFCLCTQDQMEKIVEKECCDSQLTKVVLPTRQLFAPCDCCLYSHGGASGSRSLRHTFSAFWL